MTQKHKLGFEAKHPKCSRRVVCNNGEIGFIKPNPKTNHSGILKPIDALNFLNLKEPLQCGICFTYVSHGSKVDSKIQVNQYRYNNNNSVSETGDVQINFPWEKDRIGIIEGSIVYLE